jgi:hypothetical protein
MSVNLGQSDFEKPMDFNQFKFFIFQNSQNGPATGSAQYQMRENDFCSILLSFKIRHKLIFFHLTYPICRIMK